MANIDDFKANLIGGGARANQYRVTITPPSGIAIGLDVSRTSFLCTAAALPGATLGTFEVPFRGRIINIAGDRPAFPDWTTTFYNDTDFMIRNAMERWQNGINDFVDNTGVIAPADFQTDLQIEQSIGEIALSSAEATEIETFEVTWKYQHFEASGVNF